MDWLTFIASLVSSLAWPGVALILILAFRHQIGDLLGRVVEAEGFGFKGKFDRAATAVARAAAEAGLASGSGAAHDATVEVHESLASTLASMAKGNPSGAVMAAWAEVEKGLREKVGDLGVRQPSLAGTMLARVAHERGVISESTLKAIEGLSSLRNLAAHGKGGDFDSEQALEYLSLADATLYAIRTWRPRTQ